MDFVVQTLMYSAIGKSNAPLHLGILDIFLRLRLELFW